MAVNPELRSVLERSFTIERENRDVVPVTFAHKILHKLAMEKFPNDAVATDRIVARYSPMAEWLTRTQTINEFTLLKRNLMNISASDRLTDSPDRDYWNGVRVKDAEPLNTLFDLSTMLNIVPKSHEEYINKWKNWSEVIYTSLEETRNINAHRFLSHPHLDLESLLGRLKLINTIGLVGRRGLIIGDFRVGMHKAHIDLIARAKRAVGPSGQLIVITPSKKTILNTTSKTVVWDDVHRSAVLDMNLDIDQLWVADMPAKYYSDPSAYWRYVWSAIKPDFIFLGEKNHPLQPVYQIQSKYLGGILLIDDAPVTVRSADLLPR